MVGGYREYLPAFPFSNYLSGSILLAGFIYYKYLKADYFWSRAFPIQDDNISA
jgi:hypothetical protein